MTDFKLGNRIEEYDKTVQKCLEERSREGQFASLSDDDQQTVAPTQLAQTGPEFAHRRKAQAAEEDSEIAASAKADRAAKLTSVLRSGKIEAIIYVGMMLVFWLLSDPSCWDR